MKFWDNRQRGVGGKRICCSMSTEQKHVCVLCNAKLESKEKLQEHFRKHANKEIDSKGRPIKPKTPVNSKVIVTNNQQGPTNAGIAKTGTEVNSDIVCDVCGQQYAVISPVANKERSTSTCRCFESVTIAIQHKFRKHPERTAKHFCPHCGMQFPLKINRDKHLSAEHPDIKPSKLFPCTDCGVVFYTEEAQTYHTKSTHKRIVALFKPVATPPPTKKIKVNNAGEAQSVYYCHLCGFEYIVKFNLQKHLERQHSERERDKVPDDLIKCTTCDALFYNKRAYDNHNMYHKPDDLYVTSEEQRLQTVSRVDQDFDIRRVQLAAEKFIPVNRPRIRPPPIQQQKKRKKGKELDSLQIKDEDELSPADSPVSSSESSDSDSDIPLMERLKKYKRRQAKKKQVK